MRVCTVALFMVGAVAVGTTRQAAAQNEFHWKGPVAAGKAIEIKGGNGDVRAIAGSGDAEVAAVKHPRPRDPDAGKTEGVEEGDGGTSGAGGPGAGGRRGRGGAGRGA